MAQQLDPKQKTEDRLSKHIRSLEEQFSEERLQGLSESQLQIKFADLIREEMQIKGQFPPNGGISGHYRAYVFDDESAAINPLSAEQTARLNRAVDRCETRIQRELTRRRDERKERRYQRITGYWDRLNETLRSLPLWPFR